MRFLTKICPPSEVCARYLSGNQNFRQTTNVMKREGVQKSIGHKVPWKTGPAERSSLSLCNFATTHLTASILNICLPLLTSRPMKLRTLSQCPEWCENVRNRTPVKVRNRAQKGRKQAKKVQNSRKQGRNGEKV